MKTTKRLLLGYCIFPFIMLFTVIPAQSETIIDSATVSGTWTLACSPYLITNTIEIPPDSTLTIEPGVTVEFQGHYALHVKGRLLAIGTESDTILFTTNDTTGFSDPDTTLGSWNGIRFIDTPAQNDSSKIIYCRIQYGKAVGNVWHINAGGAICVIDFDKLLISNCLITHNSCGGLETEVPSGGAIHLHMSDIRLLENTISYNRALEGGAIQTHDSNPVYIRNIISHNHARQAGGISVAGSAIITFSHDKFINNHAAIEGGGLIVWESTVVSLNNATFLANQAQYAAGISLHGGELHINGGEIAQNKAGEWGGGIGTWSGELYIDGCMISQNAVPIWGGGIAANSTALHISNTTFSNDSSGFGSGALHADHSTVDLEHCNFTQNHANFGGAIHTLFSQLNVKYCDFLSNKADYAAGIHIENGDVTVDSSLFSDNYAVNEAGAIEVRTDSLIFNRPYLAQILRSEIKGNEAGFRIAGIKIEQLTTGENLIDLLIENCRFTDNLAQRVTTMRILGSLNNFTISNCIFERNETLTYLAGIGFFGCQGKVENCLFLNNLGGAALTVTQEAQLDVFNCTFANNWDEDASCLTMRQGGSVKLFNSIMWYNKSRQIRLTTANDIGCELYVNYCDVQNGLDSVFVSDSLSHVNWESGNIQEAPLFADTAAMDYHLQDISPCIGAGVNCLKLDDVSYCAPPFDIEGNIRPDPDGSNPDLGVYEHALSVPSHLKTITDEIPRSFALAQNYPNPFNPATTITFQIPIKEYVTLKVFDMLGRRVVTLISGELAPGNYISYFDGTNHASGLYYYQLIAGDNRRIRKMILIK